MISVALAICLGARPTGMACLGPLPDVSRAFEDAYGVQLVTPKALSSQVLYVRCTEVGPEEVVHRIADSLDCTATLVDGKWRLTVDSKLLAKRKAEERRTRLKRLIPQLVDLQKQTAHTYRDVLEKLIQGGAPEGFDQKGTPSYRLLAKLVGAIGADRLSAIDSYEVVTFSSSPGLQDSALPAEAGALICQFDKENKELSLASEALSLQLGNTRFYSETVAPAQKWRAASLVSLIASKRRDHLQATLCAYSADKSPIGQAGLFLTGDEAAKPIFGGTVDPVEFPQGAAQVLSSDEPWTAPAKVGLQIWQEMKDEPLSFVAKPLLDQLASNHSAQLAIALPDSVHAALSAAKPRTEADLCRALGSAGVALDLDKDWLVSRLFRQSKLGQLNLDRQSLRSFADHWTETGAPWLRQRALLAWRNGKAGWFSNLDEWVVERVVSPIRGSYVFPPLLAPETMRSLGSLSEPVWQSYLAGGSVLFGPSSEEHALLTRLSYGPRALLLSWGTNTLADQDRNGAVLFANGAPGFLALKGGLQSDRAMMGGPFGKLPVSLPSAARLAAENVGSPTESEVSRFLSVPIALGTTESLSVEIHFGVNYMTVSTQPMDGFRSKGEPVLFPGWDSETRVDFMAFLKSYFSERSTRDPAKPPWSAS